MTYQTWWLSYEELGNKSYSLNYTKSVSEEVPKGGLNKLKTQGRRTCTCISMNIYISVCIYLKSKAMEVSHIGGCIYSIFPLRTSLFFWIVTTKCLFFIFLIRHTEPCFFTLCAVFLFSFSLNLIILFSRGTGVYV